MYATVKSLVERFTGQEIVELGFPANSYKFIGRSANAAALPTDFPAAVTDDVALASAEDALYRFDGATWSALATEKIDRAIADAESEINGYLEGRYTLPLGSVPKVIEKLAADISRYQLFDDRVTDVVQERYKSAVKFLMSISKGDVSLGLDDSGNSTDEKNSVEFKSGGNVFDRSDDAFI